MGPPGAICTSQSDQKWGKGERNAPDHKILLFARNLHVPCWGTSLINKNTDATCVFSTKAQEDARRQARCCRQGPQGETTHGIRACAARYCCWLPAGGAGDGEETLRRGRDFPIRNLGATHAAACPLPRTPLALPRRKARRRAFAGQAAALSQGCVGLIQHRHDSASVSLS